MKSGQQTIRLYHASMRVSHRSRRQGFSLLEVLVVLIVLLIGIVAVLQLFPGGFLTIQRTGEQTLAVQLAGQQMEAQRDLLVQPDYIVPGLPDDQGNIHEILGIRPDDISQATDADIAAIGPSSTPFPWNLAPNYPGYFFSDINKIRFIKGETFRVPIANPDNKLVDSNGVPYGSLYTLQFGPIYNFFNTSTGKDSLNVYGAALTRTLQSSLATIDQPDPRPLLRSENEYAIDYANHNIAFFPRIGKAGQTATRSFRVTLDYYDTSVNPPALQTVTGSLAVPDLDPNAIGAGAVPTPAWQDIFTGFTVTSGTLPTAANQGNIRQDSDDVSRLFTLISKDTSGAAVSPPVFQGAAKGPQWSDDPYEYTWYTPQQNGANANAGIILFNPRGHTSSLSSSNITDAQTQAAAQSFANSQSLLARVDYLVFDNHIIRDQRTMPASGPYTVKLSLPNVLTNGDLLDDASSYNGLFQAATAGTPDIFVFDANNGAEISEMSQGAVPNNAAFVPFTLDATSGTLTFVTTTADGRGVDDPNNKLQGRPLRILYRTQKNWGQQVQKASSMYTPAASVGAVTYKTFFIGDGTNGTQPTLLYFAPSEAGKTINLGEYYLKTSTGSIFAPYKNETFRIDDNPANFQLGGPVIDITQAHPTSDPEHSAYGANPNVAEKIIGFTAAPTGRAINYVRGLSIKSRVIWKSSSRFRQIDEDSVLPTDRP